MRLQGLFLTALVTVTAAAVGCGSSETTTGAGGSSSSTGAGDSSSVTGTATSTGTGVAEKDIVDTAVGAPNLKTLVAAVKAAGLVDTLKSAGPFTVFAPDDAAFTALPKFLLPELTAADHKADLQVILKYHVLAGAFAAKDLLGAKKDYPNAEGGSLSVDGSDGKKVTVNVDSTVTTADINCSNGVVHIVDKVILPSIADTISGYDDGTTTGGFSTLKTALGLAGLVDKLDGPGTFTVFAPTDKAFADLKTALGEAAFNALLADKVKLTKVLTYHVLGATAYSPDVKAGDVTTLSTDKLTVAVAGGKVTLKDSTATAANVTIVDLPNRNGVIHVIDKVLVPAGVP